METVFLFYAVVIACVEGVCDEYVIAEKPLPIAECIELAKTSREKFLYLDEFAVAICSPESEYN